MVDTALITPALATLVLGVALASARVLHTAVREGNRRRIASGNHRRVEGDVPGLSLTDGVKVVARRFVYEVGSKVGGSDHFKQASGIPER